MSCPFHMENLCYAEISDSFYKLNEMRIPDLLHKLCESEVYVDCPRYKRSNTFKRESKK